jgi:hypothetical protein
MASKKDQVMIMHNLLGLYDQVQEEFTTLLRNISGAPIDPTLRARLHSEAVRTLELGSGESQLKAIRAAHQQLDTAISQRESNQYSENEPPQPKF